MMVFLAVLLIFFF